MTDGACPACNTPYTEHLGLAGTCAELQRMKRARPVKTHWAECWRSHHECAVAKIEELQARLKEKP